ncbi:MAG: regulatory protein RecX [Candidatus Nanopelagicales bacterium]
MSWPDTAGAEPAGGRGRGMQAHPEAVARLILLRQLERLPKTRAQLASSLAQRNVEPELAERLLDRFAEVGLIDDAAFASMWVESRSRSKGLSRRALQAELQRKGISREDQESALQQLTDEDQLEAAISFAQGKARRMEGLDPQVARRRLAGALSRRGYGPGISFRVAQQVIAESRS